MAGIKEHKQADIAREFSINSPDIKSFRDEHLLHGTHWEKSGATIMWSDHAYWLFKQYLRNKDLKTDIKEVTIISTAINPRFVYGVLDGIRIPISCHPNLSSRLKNKTVKVNVKTENGETYYSYTP